MTEVLYKVVIENANDEKFRRIFLKNISEQDVYDLHKIFRKYEHEGIMIMSALQQNGRI